MWDMGTSKESKGPSRKSRKNEKAEKPGVEGSSQRGKASMEDIAKKQRQSVNLKIIEKRECHASASKHPRYQ